MRNGYVTILRAAVGCVALGLCLQTAAYAGERNIHSYYGKEVSAEDIVSRFLGEAAGTSEPQGWEQFRTRGIRIRGEENERLETRVNARKTAPAPAASSVVASTAAGKSAPQKQPSGACPGSASEVALPINFALNSAILEAEAYGKLRHMGEAMKSAALGSCKFVVEGHTDASGGTDLNQKLSERRAYAVREYLVSMSIAPSRLQPVGKGEAEPLSVSDPRAPENRRVQFRIVPK